MENLEFLKIAYLELSKALMYRKSEWKLSAVEASLLNMVFSVDYLFKEIFPNIKVLSLGDETFDEDIKFNLNLVSSSKLFDKLMMTLNNAMFKKHMQLLRDTYEDYIQTPMEYQQYMKTLENKILTLYVGENVAYDISVAFRKAAEGNFPAWSIIFSNPLSQINSKQIKTVAGLYKIVEANQTREWTLSKLINEM